MAMKVKDIAAALGVSPATISLVINNRPGIGEATRNKVKQGLIELGQQDLLNKSSTAQEIAEDKRILFLIYRKHGAAASQTPFFAQVYSQIIEGIENQAKTRGYDLMISYLDEEHFSRQAKELEKTDTDGILLLATEMNRAQVAALARGQNKPFVVVDNYLEGIATSSIAIHNQSGVYQAIEHLKSLGHRDIGYFHVDHNANNFTERYYGFLRAIDLLELPLRRENIFTIATKDGGDAVLDIIRQQLNERDSLPSAFFADNDIIASYALKVLKERNISVPETISMIGFDNVGLAELLDPPLTTIDTPKFQIGAAAVNLLIEEILFQNRNIHDQRCVQLVPSLVIRNSTRRIQE